MFGLKRKEVETINAAARRPLSAKVVPQPVEAREDAYLTEYAELAGVVGIRAPDMAVERFKQFLAAKDLPIYNLAEVIKYMDHKAERESAEQAGWEWRALRDKDHVEGARFGREAKRERGMFGESVTNTPASDFYRGPRKGVRDVSAMALLYGRDEEPRTRNIPPSSGVYDRTIPLHAVRRIALIEKEFGAPVHFFVSDYAPAPEIRVPDPFLMAVIPGVDHTRDGRFVIDFWDEPGFGIEQMLK